MRSTLRSALLALPFFVAAATARAAAPVDLADRIVDPSARVGAVREDTTEEELVRVYGSTAVTRVVDLGDNAQTTVLFAGTPDEVRIEWKNEFRSPRRITVEGGNWKTAEGLTIGSPMADIEKVNGGPFDVTGSNWDQPVRVVSWKGGNLPPRLQIDLAPESPKARVPKALRSTRSFFESTNPHLRKANLVIKRLILEW